MSGKKSFRVLSTRERLAQQRAAEARRREERLRAIVRKLRAAASKELSESHPLDATSSDAENIDAPDLLRDLGALAPIEDPLEFIDDQIDTIEAPQEDDASSDDGVYSAEALNDNGSDATTIDPALDEEIKQASDPKEQLKRWVTALEDAEATAATEAAISDWRSRVLEQRCAADPAAAAPLVEEARSLYARVEAQHQALQHAKDLSVEIADSLRDAGFVVKGLRPASDDPADGWILEAHHGFERVFNHIRPDDPVVHADWNPKSSDRCTTLFQRFATSMEQRGARLERTDQVAEPEQQEEHRAEKRDEGSSDNEGQAR